jgi:REP-associated tyrosine transposase
MRLKGKRQIALPLPARVASGRGGWRPGAGRPRRQGRRNVEHTRRPFVERRTPLHITLRCRSEVGRLRRRDGYRAVRDALGACLARIARFRVVHLSIQHNHIHMVVEASSREALARGMQAFSISCARQLNRRLGRRGPVFADRYHARALGTPREVRHALSYVLNNWRHHRGQGAQPRVFDPYSSAPAFDGWAIAWRPRLTAQSELLPTACARSWLLATGWRRHRLVSPREIPGPPDQPG